MYQATNKLKSSYPEILVVHGGVHPTIEPMKSLESGADIVVCGEGEQTLSELIVLYYHRRSLLCNYLDAVAEICYKKGEQVIHTKSRVFIQNLDEVEWPDWSEFHLESYNHSLHDYKGFALSIMDLRGWAFPCECCICAQLAIWASAPKKAQSNKQRNRRNNSKLSRVC